jgi:long-chain acyl-CoA synthetase
VNVADYLLNNRHPQDPAFLTLTGVHCYGELQRTVTQVAHYLARSGARKGERALLVSDNSPFWVAAYLGTLRAGLIAVPLAPKSSGWYLRQIAGKIGASLGFVQVRYADAVAASFPGLPLITDDVVRNSGKSEWATLKEIESCVSADDESLPAIEQDDIAALMFTSGSTGEPRGVIVSHRNIIANTNSIIASLSLTARDRIMVVLPFHYCFGASLLHTHLRVNGSLVLDHRFLYPEKVLEHMQDTACTGFAGVPSHYQILLRRSSLSKLKFPHLRYVQQAGGHLAPAFVNELHDALPGTQIYVMYGQTEATARLSCLAPEMLSEKPGSIGKPIPGVTLKVVSDDGAPLGPGATGEIVAEGESIATGYWGDDKETASTFRNGMLFTGDFGRMDEDGYFYLVGRRKEFLKCGGTRVSSRQVEEQLLEFPGLLEAAVVPMSDDLLGEAVRAFVVPRNLDPRARISLRAELLEFCARRMPASLVPKDLVILESLPKNSAGKVVKAQLQAVQDAHSLQHLSK